MTKVALSILEREPESNVGINLASGFGLLKRMVRESKESPAESSLHTELAPLHTQNELTLLPF